MLLLKHILLLFLISLSLCLPIKPIHREGSKEKLYTEIYNETNRNKNWNAIMVQNSEDSLWYPRGDKDKLSALTTLWRDYYECSIRSLTKLTHHGQVPATMVMAYVGAVARLPCSVCAPPDERHVLVWMYAELLPINKTFKPLQHNERTILEHNHLHIYNVKMEDAGMYRCQIGDSNSLVVLEVVDTDEKYSVVKPPTSRGPYESPPYSLNYDLMMFTSWSPWSECSACGKVGRRRRYGMCFLKLDNREGARRTNDNYNAEENTNIILDSNAIQLFETFPDGIPCRSRFLPSSLREVAAVQQRRSEIMIALCKVTCEAILFKVRSAKGIVLETANNTAGIYSLHQVLPKQPPLPARDTIFADFGDHITIRCPGTTLTDVPITWRFGTKTVMPRDIDKTSGGRIYINSRDHLVITKVLYRDANTYSSLAHVLQLLAARRRGGRRGAARAPPCSLRSARAAGARRAAARSRPPTLPSPAPTALCTPRYGVANRSPERVLHERLTF